MKEPIMNYENAEVYYLENLDQYDALTSGIRYRMVGLLVAKPKTAAQLGRELGISRPKAHYHLQVLYKLGLVSLVDEILINGIVEKYFIGKARFYSTDHLSEYGAQHPEEKEFNKRLSQVNTRFATTVLGITREKVFEADETRDTTKDFTFDYGTRLTEEQVSMIKAELGKISHHIRLIGEENRGLSDYLSLPYYRGTILFMESGIKSIMPEEELKDISGQVIEN